MTKLPQKPSKTSSRGAFIQTSKGEARESRKQRLIEALRKQGIEVVKETNEERMLREVQDRAVQAMCPETNADRTLRELDNRAEQFMHPQSKTEID